MKRAHQVLRRFHKPRLGTSASQEFLESIREAPENKDPELKPSQSHVKHPSQAPVGRETIQIVFVLSARAMSARELLGAMTCVHVNAGDGYELPNK